MVERSNLHRLTASKSIVFIGGTEAATALKVTRQLGFPGTIYAIHPSRDNLAGIACSRKLSELPEVPDAAFISIKREATIEIVQQLAKLGCGGVICHAAGFAELDDTGKTLQQQLINAAGDMALMGPNCYGFINALDQISPWADEHGLPPVERGIAIVTQSGNIACNFAMMKRHVPVAGLYTLGNQAVTGIAEMLEFLAADDRVTAIGLHVEGLPDIARFCAAAERACSNRKPIVLLKTGRSEQGARVTMSHTNSLSGADALYDAVCARWAIARVKSVSAFIETLKFLHHGGPISGNQMVSLSCSGGEAALISDMAEELSIDFPPFSADHKPAIKDNLNDYVVLENPLDYHTFIWNDRDKLTKTFTAAMQSGFDVAILIIDIPVKEPMDPASWILTAESWIAAAKATGSRAVTMTTLQESMPCEIADKLSQAGIAPMLGLDDGLNALNNAYQIGSIWQKANKRPALAPKPMPAAKVRPLREYDAKEMLRSAGFDVPRGKICKISDAKQTAEQLGYPVVMKISAENIAHKSDAGGVILGITNPNMLEQAATKMSQIGEEILIEQSIDDSVCELIIGLKRDPQFGLALVIGAGGILTELLQDSQTLLLPTTAEEIDAALFSLKIAPLIDGFRGKSADRKAIIAAIEKMAQFGLAHQDKIAEAEINPLIALKPGRGAVVADALIHVYDESE